MKREIDKRTEKRKVGDLGENIACSFLTNRGFEIVERNYSKKWGELDVIARKSGIVHFVEVKSISYDPSRPHIREDSFGKEKKEYRPEENMHPWKLKRLSRAIQTYLLDRKLDCNWQLDLITVKMNEQTRRARVELIENLII